ncbi:class I SAM-dependent methyltransferase [Gloeobacter morelensis MG652769]|uniref:Class I SAM-dependent methyltransferase n=2 Tax=Gloeobacter TaxID=33071 RepID=A0ABY3PHC6_9CYAN|nr:class I SAM-dependent methyltransferase [Gloeobacter morelensis MG652769]
MALKKDYICPGLQSVRVDHCFPNMVVGDPVTCPWPYLRREIPHNWYVDRRYPHVGFLNRDEVHILYNTALKFSGKKALEIGCWMGWSACHMALAKVELDIIDPLLGRAEFYTSVSDSLAMAGVLDATRLVEGCSPDKVEELVAGGARKWSLIFIDGNHDAPGPLGDAVVCEQYAESDALILFHDLAAPDVAEGLHYLRQKGWKTMIYQTMQIMGVAWRGDIEPVHHRPDPDVLWQLPSYLRSYAIGSLQNGYIQEVETLHSQIHARPERLQNLLASAQEAREWLQSKLQQTQAQVLQTNAQNQQLQSQIEQLQKDRIFQQGRYDELEAWNGQLQQGKDYLEARCSELEAWNGQLQQGKDYLEARCSELEAWNGQLQQGKDYLEARCSELEAWNGQLLQGKDYLNDQLEQTRKCVEVLQSDRDHLDKLKTALQEQLECELRTIRNMENSRLWKLRTVRSRTKKVLARRG